MRHSLFRLLPVIVAAVLTVGCSGTRKANTLSAEGQVTRVETVLPAFNAVSVSSGIRLFLTDSPENKLVVEANENIHPYVQALVVDGKLVLKLKDDPALKGKVRINAYIPASSLTALSASNGAHITGEAALPQKRLHIDLTSGSRFKGTIDASYLMVNLTSGSYLELYGFAEDFILYGSSGVRAECFFLAADNVTVKLNSGSKANVQARYLLDVATTAASEVYYQGEASVIGPAKRR